MRKKISGLCCIENEFSDIILLKQKKREGKASAINLFLKYAKGDIVVLESGDTIPAEDTIEHLTQPFKNPNVGMTGGRPVPVNNKDTFLGFTVHLLWNLHHMLAIKHPKLGELIAFRRHLIKQIPVDTAVDEAFIEAIITEKGYKLEYVPEAVVYNKGPETISDFLRQRRRIFAGHIHLKKIKGYAPSSMKICILKLILKNAVSCPRDIYTLGAIALELYGRILGLYDFYIKNENPFIWNIAKTTKDIKYDAKKIQLWSVLNQNHEQILPETGFVPNIILNQALITKTLPTIPKEQKKLKYEKGT